MDQAVAKGVTRRLNWMTFEGYLLESSLVCREEVFREMLQFCNGAMLQCYNAEMVQCCNAEILEWINAVNNF